MMLSGQRFRTENMTMNITRRVTIALIAVGFSFSAIGAANAAGTTINVSLWDKGDHAMEMLGSAPPMGMAMGAGPGNMAPQGNGMMGKGMMGGAAQRGPMGISLERDTVPAGEVTFKAINDSKTMVHEMVVAPVADTARPLPYIKDEERVDEDAAGHLGEVAELEPGQSGALTLTLKPGTYILYCNIPGHYMLGMWTLLTVTQ